MRTLAVDWATKKEFVVYDGTQAEKITNSIESVIKFVLGLGKEKCQIIFEAGGGDLMKVLAFRNGYDVYTIAGQLTKSRRVEEGIEKTDTNDAILLYKMFSEWAGGTRFLSPSLTNGTPPHQLTFYKFSELNTTVALLRLLYRRHEVVKEEMVRVSNRATAFQKIYQLSGVQPKKLNDQTKKQKMVVKLYKDDMNFLKNQMNGILKTLPLWTEKYKKVRGIGPAIAGGLIAELGRCTATTEDQVRKFTGMIPRKVLGVKSAGRFKLILYLFMEQVIKQKTPKWNEMYYAKKEHFKALHPDWKPGKCHAWACRAVMTKFVIEFWKDMKQYGMLGGTISHSPNQAKAETPHSAFLTNESMKTGRADKKPPKWVVISAPVPSSSKLKVRGGGSDQSTRSNKHVDTPTSSLNIKEERI